ncbi:MAG: hypothetical protein KatS3mg121_0547 [Gammaproteobacteria bacterium]|nr:MAG: hypothetical protein KatS3mg121_0547 [Gammaproteobacteria bacterium]
MPMLPGRTGTPVRAGRCVLDGRQRESEMDETTQCPAVLLVGAAPDFEAVAAALLERGVRCAQAADAGRALAGLEGGATPLVVLADAGGLGERGGHVLARAAALAPEARLLLLCPAEALAGIAGALNALPPHRLLVGPCPPERLLEAVLVALAEAEALVERRRLARRLARSRAALRRLGARLQAHTGGLDSVSGLPGPAHILARLDELLRMQRARPGMVAVACLGVDDFRLVNENLGREAGNAVLAELGARLRGLELDAEAGRLDGDRFLLLLPDARPGAGLERLLENVLAQLSRPFVLGERSLQLGLHAGVALAPRDGQAAAVLLNHAESALHQAKRGGQRRLVFYSDDLARSASVRFALRSELPAALERGEFRVHYQPRVSVRDGRIVGVEALLRWQHPLRGLLPPAEFLHLLEESGLIRPVGEWLLEEVCAQARRWQELLDRPLHVAVNVSPLQLHGGRFAEALAAARSRAGLDARRIVLEVEITENLFLDPRDGALEELQALRAAGVKIAIDDFGTGYSVLAQLTRLPIDYLKIDRSFVLDVAVSAEARSLVRAITALARGLHLAVVAEGIELPEQLGALRALDCEEFQGFLFSRPLVAERLGALLAADVRAGGAGLVLRHEPAYEEPFYR